MGLNDTLREFLTAQPGQLRIDINKIRPNPNQPRQSIDETSEQFLELRSSILAHDLLQPVLLCRPDKGGTYVILAGERRWRAFCSLAPLDSGRFSTIPAVIQNDLPHGPEVSPMIIGLLENCVREDLKPGERAAAVARIRGKTGWTFREIGQHMGLTEPRVQELAAVGRHEVLVQALNQGDINQEKAILVARAARNDQQLALQLTSVAQRATPEELAQIIGEVKAQSDHEGKLEVARTIEKEPREIADLIVVRNTALAAVKPRISVMPRQQFRSMLRIALRETKL